AAPVGRGCCLLVLVYGSDLARAVKAAVGAHFVRRLWLATLRAAARRRGLERVVGAALTAAGLGVSSLWIRHRRAFASLTTSSNQPFADPRCADCNRTSSGSGSPHTAGKSPGSRSCTTASLARPGKTVRATTR